MTSDPATPDRRTSSDRTIDVERDAGLDYSIKAQEHNDDGNLPTNSEKGSTSPPAVGGNDTAPASDDKDAVAQPLSKEAADPEASRTKLENFLVVSALCLALFLAALDVTIITTAIPTISSHFNSSTGYIWIGSAYLLGNATFVPTWGKISDIFGRKPVLIGAVGIFWIGSLLCAISNSMGMLIAARAIQGIGGGGTIVLPNICVSDLFSMRKRGLYFGLFGGVWAIASAIGPVLGGVFTSQVSWRWCFYINLPVSGVGMIILMFVLKLHNPRTPVKQGLVAIDWLGSLLIIGGTLMFLFGLEFGGVQYPWKSAMVICLIVFGLVTVGLFVAYESKVAKYPIIPVGLFRHRNSVAAFAVAFLHAFTFMGGSYWLPLYFQAVMGTTSLLSGVYLLPFVLALSVVSAGVGLVIKKTGNYKLPIMSGLAVMTLGFGLLIDLGADRNWVKIIIFQIVAGLGVGPNFQSPLIALQTNVEPRDIGSATASFGFLRQMGTATSVAVGGVIFNNQMQAQQGKLVKELGTKLASMFTGERAAASVHIVGTLTSDQARIVQDAYWNALQKMYILYTCTAFAAFAISFGIRQKKLSKSHTEHKTGLQSLKHRNEDKANVASENKIASEA